MVNDLFDLRSYKGLKIVDRLKDPEQKEVFLANYNQMKANYGDNVDGALLDEQILFCSDTIDYLYGEECRKTYYVKGSRPQLEKIVNQLTENAKTDFDRAICVLRFCRDLYRKNDGRLLFFGGSEEDLINKGEQLCECLARLMVALCEIMGIPGRIITHIVGGHLTCELCVDGSWGYFDPRTGLFFIKKDGKLASLYDLISDPSIIENQSDNVKKELSERWTYEQRISRCKIFFSKKEINTVKFYSLSNKNGYNYKWLFFNDLWKNEMNTKAAEYEKAINAVLGVKGAVKEPYFDFSVKNGQEIDADTMIVVVPREMVVPPIQIEALIDGVKVWVSDKTTDPAYIFSPIDVEYFLFGENSAKIIENLSAGLHELTVRAVDDVNCFGKVLFSKRRKLDAESI